MKKSSAAEAKMEIKADTMLTDLMSDKKTEKQAVKHIQKVAPAKPTVVSDPGGCRPTGT